MGRAPRATQGALAAGLLTGELRPSARAWGAESDPPRSCTLYHVPCTLCPVPCALVRRLAHGVLKAPSQALTTIGL